VETEQSQLAEVDALQEEQERHTPPPIVQAVSPQQPAVPPPPTSASSNPEQLPDPDTLQLPVWCLSEDDACCLHSVLTALLCEQVLNWASSMNRNNKQAWLPISEARQLDIPAGPMCDQIRDQLKNHDGLC
jgi:hypothetical protein